MMRKNIQNASVIIKRGVKYMLNILLVVLFAMSSGTAFTQQISSSLICSSGDNFTLANQSLEFTIGDIVTETFQNNDGGLSQGFLQGTTQGTGIKGNIMSHFNIDIFPNPAHDGITVICNKKALSMEIVDLSGHVLIRKKNPAETETFNTVKFQKGVYLLKTVFERNIPVVKRIVKY